ncbi:MAG: tRNA (adenosine(37)-N6)-threonylcarbamoyltransferase complex ATPase subunit type 1 TsaE [Candidatus Pacebacteria bacterium]|nr:tRNA (adenosine(37)-N6)-threonylcarbamoyltransferase complex ATPase subunit type 1 TsaE [Candidatus Paceibacterota bacterium]
MKVISNNFLETKRLGKQLADKILSCKNKPIILSLRGDLGSGKTTFVQGFASALGIKKKILSPTFVILNKFKIKDRFFYHIDCYRIENIKEVKSLGLEEIFKNPNNIVLVEWGEKIKKILPSNTIKIKFEFLEENKRKITYEEKDICSD